MKKINLEVGVVLLVLGLVFLGGASLIGASRCAGTRLGSYFSGLPLCSSTLAEAAVLGVVGLVLFVVAIVEFATGGDGGPMTVPVLLVPPKFCDGCGHAHTGPLPILFCPSCGKATPPPTAFMGGLRQ